MTIGRGERGKRACIFLSLLKLALAQIRELHRVAGYYIAFTVIFRLLLWVKIRVRPTDIIAMKSDENATDAKAITAVELAESGRSAYCTSQNK